MATVPMGRLLILLYIGLRWGYFILRDIYSDHRANETCNCAANTALFSLLAILISNFIGTVILLATIRTELTYTRRRYRLIVAIIGYSIILLSSSSA